MEPHDHSARRYLWLLRDALALLALALAVVGLDGIRETWLRWWPLPPAVAAIGLTLVMGGARLRWRDLAGLAFIFSLAALTMAVLIWRRMRPILETHETRTGSGDARRD